MKDGKVAKSRKKIIILAALATCIVMITVLVIMRWGTVEVRVKDVNYDKLEKEIGEFYRVPSTHKSEVMKAEIYFPEPSEGSNQNVGEYNNFTVRYKYAVGYNLDLVNNGIKANIYVTNTALTLENKEGCELIDDGKRLLYYKVELQRSNVRFDDNGNAYSISVYGTDDECVKYLKYLVDNILI